MVTAAAAAAAAAAMTVSKYKAKRDLSGVVVHKPSNNKKKQQQVYFEMMLVQTYGSREKVLSSRADDGVHSINHRIHETKSYQDKEEKIKEDELIVLNISQDMMDYQEK
eukprot:13747495-Ditylum_brightwellii.AAC.1